jgi:hypothetical protein
VVFCACLIELTETIDPSKIWRIYLMSNLKRLSNSFACGVFGAMAVHSTIFDRPKLSKISAIKSVSKQRPSVEEALASDWKAIGGDIKSAIHRYSIEHDQKSK